MKSLNASAQSKEREMQKTPGNINTEGLNLIKWMWHEVLKKHSYRL